MDTILALSFGHEAYNTFTVSQRFINIALLVLTNIVELAIGLWLFFQAKTTNAAKWIWLMLGFVFGISAVILYYLIKYIDVLTHKKEAGDTTSAAAKD